MELILNEAEIRVLGCMIEKELTTPDTYPISLNSLRLACCQKSNRNPVVQMEDSDVLRAIDGLMERKLAALYHAAGGRVPKYTHRFDKEIRVGPTAVAVLAELMLRGPQTVGELRTRASRMHPMESLDEVHQVLNHLMELEDALAVKLPLQPGRKEPRYMHLIGGELDLEDLPTPPAPTEKIRMSMQVEDERIAKLESEVQALRTEVDGLHEAFRTFKSQFE